MLEKMQPVVSITTSEVLPIRIPPPDRLLSPPIIAVNDVNVGYEPGKPVLKRLNFRIDDDDRIGLLGANGNGKSTFAKLIAGRLAPSGGRLSRPNQLAIAYFAQHQLDELGAGKSAYDHVRELLPDETEARVRARTGALGFPTAKMDTPARDLSGGEKARLLLGLATFTGANLLILDEPTNHLDIDSREALVHGLANFPGAVILISHDRHLLEASADRLWLVANGTVANFDGDIDDYRRQVLESRNATQGEAKGLRPTQNLAQARRREAAEKREQTAPLRKKIKETESLIEKLQKEIQAIDGRLADPKVYAQPAKVAEHGKARADAVRALAAAEERWLELSGELEAAGT
jgi:ATP-binding cassette subfamily F protein 3